MKTDLTLLIIHPKFDDEHKLTLDKHFEIKFPKINPKYIISSVANNSENNGMENQLIFEELNLIKANILKVNTLGIISRDIHFELKDSPQFYAKNLFSIENEIFMPKIIGLVHFYNNNYLNNNKLRY